MPWPGWLSWLEHRPTHQKTAGLIPRSGRAWEAASQCFSLTLMCVSVYPTPNPKPSLSKSNEKVSSGEDEGVNLSV